MSVDVGELLAPHANRKVRRILSDDSDRAVCDALWSLIYGRTVVDHATALAVDAELMMTTKTVGDVLAGWRPAALEAKSA